MVEQLCEKCGRMREIYATDKCKSCYNYIHRDKEKNRENYRRWKQRRREKLKQLNSEDTKDGSI